VARAQQHTSHMGALSLLRKVHEEHSHWLEGGSDDAVVAWGGGNIGVTTPCGLCVSPVPTSGCAPETLSGFLEPHISHMALTEGLWKVHTEHTHSSRETVVGLLLTSVPTADKECDGERAAFAVRVATARADVPVAAAAWREKEMDTGRPTKGSTAMAA
jgi:hypothetical protein